MSKPNLQPMQRAAPLVQLPALLAELGVEVDAVFDGTGISASDLRPDAFIPFAGAQLILDRAATLSGCDDIGLRLGRLRGIAALGPVGEAMRYAGTLGEALSDFVAFQLGNYNAAAVYLLRGSDDVALGYGVYEFVGNVSLHVHDLAMAVGHKVIAGLTLGAVEPVEIWSIRKAPADLTPYRELFNCPIRFGQSQSCLFLSHDSMDFALPSANRLEREKALGALAAYPPLAPWAAADRVRHALRSLMLRGRTSMPEVAGHLGLHARSLRRALLREGTTFDAVKGAVRYAVARELLALTPLQIGDIGMTLDFDSPSAFVRAFRRWSGITPTRWRTWFQSQIEPGAGRLTD